VGLRILAPSDGAVVKKDAVTLVGLARPGATITHDIPFWPDDHAKADASGRWAMTVALDPGENEIRLRIGDDRSTETVLRVVSAT
jgi:hypothetical protein